MFIWVCVRWFKLNSKIVDLPLKAKSMKTLIFFMLSCCWVACREMWPNSQCCNTFGLCRHTEFLQHESYMLWSRTEWFDMAEEQNSWKVHHHTDGWNYGGYCCIFSARLSCKAFIVSVTWKVTELVVCWKQNESGERKVPLSPPHSWSISAWSGCRIVGHGHGPPLIHCGKGVCVWGG